MELTTGRYKAMQWPVLQMQYLQSSLSLQSNWILIYYRTIYLVFIYL